MPRLRPSTARMTGGGVPHALTDNITVDQYTPQRSGNPSSLLCTVTWASTPAVGALMVCSISISSATITAGPPGWALLGSCAFQGANTTYGWWKVAGAGETTTPAWTATSNGGFFIANSLSLKGFQGTPTVAPAPNFTGTASSVTSQSSGSVTPATPLGVAVAGFYDGSWSAQSLTNGFTLQHNGGDNGAFGWKPYTTIAALTTTASWTTANSIAAFIAAFDDI